MPRAVVMRDIPVSGFIPISAQNREAVPRLRSVVRRLGLKLRNALGRTFYTGATLAEYVSRRRAGDRPIVVWPVVDDVTQLGDLVARLEWAVPAMFPRRDILVPIASTLSGITLSEIRPPTYLERYPASNLPVRLVEPAAARALFDESSLIVVRRAAAMLDPRLLRHASRLAVIDPEFYSPIEYVLGWGRIKGATCDPSLLRELAHESRENFARLLADVRPARVINLFGRGPGLREADRFDLSRDLNIVCNATVRSRAILERLSPRIIAIADAFHYLGPARYGARFREDLVAAASECDAFVVAPAEQAYLLAAHHPALRRRIIGLGFGRTMTVPTPAQPEVLPRNNILTVFMLPMALACEPHVIQIWGCDGRPPVSAERRPRDFVWQRHPATEYEDLTSTVRAAHPAYFRDLPEDEYYALHVRELSEALTFAERRGVSVRSCSLSFIPALAARAAPPECPDRNPALVPPETLAHY
jgi:hypothetical protein